MSKPALPKHLEPYKLADAGASYEGRLPVSAFSRLMECLESDQGEIEITLQFGVNDDGYRELQGRMTGEVEVLCQRCLNGMPYQLDANIHIGFAYHEEMAEAMPRYLDPLVLSPDQRITPVELLEDDLLLSLPSYIVHGAGECSVKTEFGDDGSEQNQVEKPEKTNPFSVLADLKPGQKH